MTAPTHVLIGLSATIVFVRVHGVSINALDLLMLLIGSLLPDIDGEGAITRPGGILRRFLPWSVARMLDGITIALSRFINLLFGHRGFIHAPVLWLAVAGYGSCGKPFIFWLGFGAFFHVLGDACTVSGIPVLSPLSKRRYSFAPVRTGGALEGVIAAALLVFTISFGFKLLPQGIQRGFYLLILQSKL